MELQSTKQNKAPSKLNALEDCNKVSPEVPKAILDKLNALQSQMKTSNSHKEVTFKDDDIIKKLESRLDSEMGDLKYELNHLQRDVELRKNQEYNRIMDNQANAAKPDVSFNKGSAGSKFNRKFTCFHCKLQGHRFSDC